MPRAAENASCFGSAPLRKEENLQTENAFSEAYSSYKYKTK
jgi:hypothetical protein